MLNKVFLIGRLVKDVEFRITNNGKPVVNASLATNKKFKNSNGDYEERVEFHNLVIWQGADNFAKYLSKGSKVYIEGELTTEVYEKDGVKKYTTKIIVNNFIFLDSKGDKQENNQPEQKEEVIDIPEEPSEDINIQNIPF